MNSNQLIDQAQFKHQAKIKMMQLEIAVAQHSRKLGLVNYRRKLLK